MTDHFVLVKTRSYIERVPIDEILSIQREGRLILVITEDKEYEFYGKMEDIVTNLDERFFKCHGGCYVNLDKIRLLEAQELSFYNGYNIYLGRTNFIRTKQTYYSYHTKQS